MVVLSYFGLREWQVEDENVRLMRKTLSLEESNYLEFDINQINWDEFFVYYIPGIKKHFLKEDLDMDHCSKLEVKQKKRLFIFFLCIFLSFSFINNEALIA